MLLTRIINRFRGLYEKVEVEGRVFRIRALAIGSLHALAEDEVRVRKFIADGASKVEVAIEDQRKALESLCAILAHGLDRDIEWVKAHVTSQQAWTLLGHVWRVSGFSRSDPQ